MRLLVAEDDPRMAALLRRGLAEEGYTVDLVDDGLEVVWLVGESPYAAVVLDVMLPGCDGFTVCRRLRAARRWVPVLMLTARDEVADRVEGLDAGADDYLVKPFSFAELAARVRALVRRGQGDRPPVLSAGTLKLDPARRRAWRNGVELLLSPTEFALLELFLRNPGIVLTRTQILDHVWDLGYAGTSNVVDQYVRYLRAKVDRPFGLCDLETVRGVGYRLREPPAG